MEPLVSILVITYNSSQTVLETLESAKNQDYKNIELIVSDDCSTDDTVEKCKKWLDAHTGRFTRTLLVETKRNNGVSANCNRAISAAQGEWGKLIAGDDILLPNCIEDNIMYILQNPDAVFVFSKLKVFGGHRRQRERQEKQVIDYSFFTMSPKEQFERIKYGSCLPTASAFCNINKMRYLGLRYDERIPLLEDRPMWITVIKKGLKFHFFEKETVMYRLSEQSLSTVSFNSVKFYESKRLAFYYYVFQDMYEENPELAINESVRLDVEQYKLLLKNKIERDKYLRLSPYIFIVGFNKIIKRLKCYFRNL